MKPRPLGRGLLLSAAVVWGFLQAGCLLFCGKSKLTFQNRCALAPPQYHVVYVNGERITAVAPTKDFTYDVDAGDYTVMQTHPAGGLTMTSTLCGAALLSVPRCSEVVHSCNF